MVVPSIYVGGMNSGVTIGENVIVKAGTDFTRSFSVKGSVTEVSVKI